MYALMNLKKATGKDWIIEKKKEPKGSVGIKNSWKYEKDLSILNGISVLFTITRMDKPNRYINLY